MKLSVLAAQHMAVLPIGCVLTDDQVLRSLRDATRFYCGHADLTSGGIVGASALGDTDADDVEVSESELSIIKPLWLLYLERENSTALEASKTQGAEVFGRAVSEVQASIIDYETRLPALAFSEDWVTI
ncbi:MULTISPECIES: hypothetical protein [unclassified Pseudomonas]|uniref:hypothetical protein n=1 Tax=unclassified Pseudomonas TaxID=196821 RepID=UPI000A1E0552|nr:MULTISPECIES: hypothetical protein [unclassified Pseudomonas]